MQAVSSEANLKLEKRWSERKELSVGVDIYQQGALVSSCFSHDIGLGGTFLGTEPSVVMSKDADVELVFHLDSSGHISRHKIHARVTRVSSQGAGFKFCDFDTGVFRSLQEIMSYKSDSATDINNPSTSH